jgi:hypothetical protein
MTKVQVHVWAKFILVILYPRVEYLAHIYTLME